MKNKPIRFFVIIIFLCTILGCSKNPKDIKAETITIYKEDGRGIRYGKIAFGIAGFGSLELEDASETGIVSVVIFRAILEDQKKAAKELGIRPGVAYQELPGNKYKYICKVDLTMSDDELCDLFGIGKK